MNNGIEQVGVELSESELALIQGGGFFGDVWDGIKSVGKAVYNFAKSDTGKKILSGAATVIGLVFGAGGGKSGY